MDVELQSVARSLQSLNAQSSIYQGKQIHLLFLKKGLINSTLSLANRLLQMYTRCGGTMADAHKLFDEMPDRNCFSWNTVIEGYMKFGDKDRALKLFDLMPCKNEFSWNVVIAGFVKACELGVARRLFNEMPRRNGIAWNSMIHGYARNGLAREALKLFKELNLNPLDESCGDTFVLASVIGACADLGAVECGKQIHARIVINDLECDSVLFSSLINLYAKCADLDSANYALNMMDEVDDFSLSALIVGYANCGRMNDAIRIFHRTSNTCFVVWNSLISGYVNNNEEMKAFALFGEMQKNGIQVDSSTITIVLSACSNIGNAQYGKQMHGYVCKVGLVDDVIVASAFIDAYSKCGNPESACKLFSEIKSYDTVLLNTMITAYCNLGRIEDAKKIFETMPSKSLISWNSMVVGFSQNGCPAEALNVFSKMNKLDLNMDRFSLASVISACAGISSVELGEQVFARAIIIGFDSDEVVATSLVDFYCKCGFVEIGRRLFHTITKSDEVSWNSLLMGYATNGHGLETLALFNEMKQAGVRPNNITFTAVLSACDHCGLVEEGWKLFNVMKHDYHIDPGIEHYSCMVDLLSRAGCLKEAIDLIEHMPYEVDASMWSSVLRGCVAHGEKGLGEKVAQRIIQLDPESSSAYVQLSGIFATTGDWGSSELVRKIMRQHQVKKHSGVSWAS
ncbi:putative pentatricopeptide repeat-containing protein At1g77010, mitochondrial [Mercurialis annua]|uniref:putative pentatricopeptide repeat-containing protein At1g77010, mitochondrial n=1 Tax=Mercurialis annua TaxID=3986 RepID=UPI00215FE46E|nr:putative pentatricopeptide repeat-containing protein At1g77010, mitochondrial [Mercurialis annua]